MEVKQTHQEWTTGSARSSLKTMLQKRLKYSASSSSITIYYKQIGRQNLIILLQMRLRSIINDQSLPKLNKKLTSNGKFIPNNNKADLQNRKHLMILRKNQISSLSLNNYLAQLQSYLVEERPVDKTFILKLKDVLIWAKDTRMEEQNRFQENSTVVQNEGVKMVIRLKKIEDRQKKQKESKQTFDFKQPKQHNKQNIQIKDLQQQGSFHSDSNNESRKNIPVVHGSCELQELSDNLSRLQNELQQAHADKQQLQHSLIKLGSQMNKALRQIDQRTQQLREISHNYERALEQSRLKLKNMQSKLTFCQLVSNILREQLGWRESELVSLMQALQQNSR